MTAIVSKDFRLNAAKKFVSDVINDYSKEYDTDPDRVNSYYVFIGRSESWDDDQIPPSPYDNLHSTYFDTWQKMTALKKIGVNDITFAAVRYQWISGTTYSEYDDRDATLASKQYYVISDNNNVYLCLKSGGISTQNPDNAGVTLDGIIDYTQEDGYIWKYLFTLSTNRANAFLTSAFIPVMKVEEEPDPSDDTAIRNQWTVQDNAVAGAVYRIKVTTPGSGYTSPPQVVWTGDGQGLVATAVLEEDENGDPTGAIAEIVVTNPGSGYNQVAITFGGGGGAGAEAYAVLSPPGGFGADPRQELRAHYAVVNSNLIYDDGQGDFIVGNDFRQLGIIRNPVDFGTTNHSTADTMMATKGMTVPSSSWTYDSVIEGRVSGAKAIVDHYNQDTGLLRYHQTEETGFKAFQSNDFVRYEGTTSDGFEVTALIDPEVEPYSGEVIFLENRTPINRAGDQIETIKLVIEF